MGKEAMLFANIITPCTHTQIVSYKLSCNLFACRHFFPPKRIFKLLKMILCDAITRTRVCYCPYILQLQTANVAKASLNAKLIFS